MNGWLAVYRQVSWLQRSLTVKPRADRPPSVPMHLPAKRCTRAPPCYPLVQAKAAGVRAPACDGGGELANMTLGSNQWESQSGHPAPVTNPNPLRRSLRRRRARHRRHANRHRATAVPQQGTQQSTSATAGTLDTPQALRGLQAVMQGQPAPARRGTAGAAPTDPAGWPWPPSKKVLQIPLHFFLATKKASSKTGLTC